MQALGDELPEQVETGCVDPVKILHHKEHGMPAGAGPKPFPQSTECFLAFAQGREARRGNSARMAEERGVWRKRAITSCRPRS